MTTGYERTRWRDGHPMQAGMRSAKADGMPWPIDTTMGWMTRAVVLSVRFADEDSRQDNAWWFNEQRNVLCDVRTMDRFQRELSNVPVMQHVAGLHDQDIYVPRGQRINTSGGASNTDSSAGPVTPAQDGDGDVVTLGFLENNPARPVILPFTLGHPNARNRPVAADGRVRRIRHAGCTIELSEDGNIVIDASTGAANELDSDGGETAGGRALRLDGETVIIGGTAAQATEPFVCGSQWKSLMTQLLTELSTLTVNTAVGPSTPPLNFQKFIDLATSVAADDQVSDFIFGRRTR